MSLGNILFRHPFGESFEGPSLFLAAKIARYVATRDGQMSVLRKVSPSRSVRSLASVGSSRGGKGSNIKNSETTVNAVAARVSVLQWKTILS
jgi:hypothetical protein